MKLIFSIFIALFLTSCSTTEDPSLARRAVERGGNVYCGDDLVATRQAARKLARIAGRRIEDVCEIMADESI